MTKVKQLSKMLGGKWSFCNGDRSWNCDDGRRVYYTAPDVDEFDNEIPYSRRCWIYEPCNGTRPFTFSHQHYHAREVVI